MTKPQWVVRMTNGRGHVEWYWHGFAVRRQADDRDYARRFDSREEAQDAADGCNQCPDAFSQNYYDSNSGTWTMTATVEPAD